MSIVKTVLNVIKCYLKNNRCYQQNRKRTPIGIQIHTIGTGQGTAESVASYWNQSGVSACVTYIVDADVRGKVLQTLPEDVYSWADAGYGNRNLITIEICESDYIKYTGGASYTVKDAARFEGDILRGYHSAVDLCADICRRYGWDPQSKLPSGLYLISSHDEGRRAGLSSAHVDPTHVWGRFGLSMDTFRAAVKAKLSGEETELYRVRKSWSDEGSQIGAYYSLDNAKLACAAGYSVYDGKGKEIYTVPAANDQSGAHGIPVSKQAYIDAVAEIAVRLCGETGILPSVVIGQCCLETGYGLGSDSVALVKVNNLLGMKADLINSTWAQYSVWSGRWITKNTPEVYGGVPTRIDAAFRAYDNYEQCIKDYEMFLLNVKNNAGYKYRSVQGKTDPREVITIISKGGYATDPKYIESVMRIIKENDLTKYDNLTATSQKSTEKPENGAKKIQIVSFLEACEKVRQAVEKDGTWVYGNTAPQAKTLDGAVKDCKRISCTLGIMWALRMIGDLTTEQSFYGSMGKVHWRSGTKAAMQKKGWQIIDLKGVSVVKAIKNKKLKAGDIVMYTNMQHTNVYCDGGMWYDFGHGYTGTSGENAAIKKVYGGTIYTDAKISYVLRKTATMYRVQIGVYGSTKVMTATASRIKLKTGYDCFTEKSGGQNILYCGSFSVMENAEKRIKELQAVGYKPIIKTI